MAQKTIHASAVRGLLKNNLSAILSPSATDDSSAGYSVGSIWVDTALDKAFTCVDSTIGAAVWSAGVSPPEAYNFIQKESSVTHTYYGFSLGSDWKIKRKDTSTGVWTVADGTGDYATAWINRVTHTYGY